MVLFCSCEQPTTGEQLLENAIAYHDPNDNWKTFNNTLFVTMETPNKPNRNSKISINLIEDYFYVKAVRDTLITEYTVTKEDCSIQFCGKTEFTEDEVKAYGLHCDRAKLYKNYYTYLYGLPMKLNDPGTNVDEKVEYKTFKGNEYLVLKVTYDEGIGSDIWYFYFNPETYAMEVYQFYRSDEHGELKEGTGEYILLTDEETISGIKMPKTRTWYYNSDDTYLGTDILKK